MLRSFACRPLAQTTRKCTRTRTVRHQRRTLEIGLGQHEITPEFISQQQKKMKGMTLKGRSIYMDSAATTRVDPRVLDAMLPHLTEQFGNAHSRNHYYGWETEQAVEAARASVADLIGCTAKEIIFTSGATESNNLAIKGVAEFYNKKHIITTQTEHKCVLDSCRRLEQDGYTISYLPVKKDGLLDLNVLEEDLKKNDGNTALVSVMTVNNEIGVVQPIKEIGELCRKYKAFFHTDAAQAVGKIPLNVDDLNIDLMSISGHKIYGPKGIGALYVRKRPRVRLVPIINGGGQERSMRSGTLPSPLCVGLGEACRVAKQEMDNDARHIKKMYDKLLHGIRSNIDDVYMNGSENNRYHGNLNMSFAYIEGESLLMALKDIACSSGSACTSASLEPSYVLRALDVGDELAHTSLRFGIGRFTTEAEIDFVIETLCKHVQKLRDMSPLWAMKQEGIDPSTIQWSQEH